MSSKPLMLRPSGAITAPRLSYRQAAWGLILLGSAIRLVVAITSPESFDMRGFSQAGREILHWGLHFYHHERGSSVNAPLPYPPGYLPWLGLVSRTGHAFRFLERLPPIAADAALAWFVGRSLAQSKVAPSRCLFGVALIALSPQLIVASARAGQIDSLAILPTLIACVAWQRGGEQRDVTAGLLIGIGTALKTIPFVALIALLPTARSRREAARLVLGAAAVPLVALAPFLAADAGSVPSALAYHGFAGAGGISLLLDSLGTGTVSAVGSTVEGFGTPLVLAALACLAAVLWRYRVSAIPGMVMVWLVVYIFGLNWFAQYAVWGIPFFVMFGALWWTLGFELLLAATSALDAAHHLPVLPEIYHRLQHVLLVGVWMLIAVGWIVGLVLMLATVRAGSRRGRSRGPVVAARGQPG